MFDRLKNHRWVQWYRGQETLRFVVGFLVLYAAFSLINEAYTGITVPGGFYNKWLSVYANYVTALRQLVLRSSSALLTLLGYQTRVTDYLLQVTGGNTVRIVYSCIGIQILCVWWAFVLSFPLRWKRRTALLLTGSAGIMLLNVLRVTVIVLLPRSENIDHHLVFNLVTYSVLILVMFRIISRSRTATAPNRTVSKQLAAPAL